MRWLLPRRPLGAAWWDFRIDFEQENAPYACSQIPMAGHSSLCKIARPARCSILRFIGPVAVARLVLYFIAPPGGRFAKRLYAYFYLRADCTCGWHLLHTWLHLQRITMLCRLTELALNMFLPNLQAVLQKLSVFLSSFLHRVHYALVFVSDGCFGEDLPQLSHVPHP